MTLSCPHAFPAPKDDLKKERALQRKLLRGFLLHLVPKGRFELPQPAGHQVLKMKRAFPKFRPFKKL